MKKIFSICLLLSVAYIISLDAVAQTRCPAGAQAGSAQCLPDDEAAAPSRPTGEWIKTWGALSSSNGMHGAWSTKGKLSEEEAREDVLSKCSQAGGRDCILDATYFNQCIAVAGSSDTGVNTNTGANEKVASQRALSDCQKKSAANCSVVFSDCTMPIFKKY
ncbi:DUF4189 domain-containing protein [Xanthomonas sacchari]|uniref:DUF4189 domain-containing protein n=1 Tax=Xanthomonas sacchari TaxID=56458 RepID=UPI0035296BEF